MVQSGLWTTLFSTPVQTLNSGCVDTLYVESNVLAPDATSTTLDFA